MDESPTVDDVGTVTSCVAVVDEEVWTLDGFPDDAAAPVDVLAEAAPVDEPAEIASVDELAETTPVDEPAEIAPMDVLAEVAPVDVPAEDVGVVGGRAVRTAR